jgi:signal transduction histidine kinase
MVFPVLTIDITGASNQGYSRPLWALAATAAYAPLYLRHVLFFIRDRRPPGAGWTLTAMTAIIAAATPLAGGWWLPSFAIVAVCLLMAGPWRWSLLGMAGLVAAQVPLALAFPAAGWPDAPDARPAYFAVTVVWRTAAVFVPVWLAKAVRQLESARRELAEDAVLRERVRVDARLRQTLGAAVAAIAVRGERSAALADGSPDSAGQQLSALIEIARSALAETRQLLRGLHQPSLLAELETAASLLTAAGIQTRLVVPGSNPPAEASAEFRAGLRLATARLLRDDAARTCVLTLTAESGQMQLDFEVDGRNLTTMTVPRS